MYEEMLPGKPPEWLELEGIVRTDPASARPRTAPAPGEVVHSRPSSPANHGDVVMSVRGSRYTSAQKLFIRTLLSDGETSQAFKTARARLTKLKFSSRQIDEIARTRAVLDPIPILSPAGVVTDALPAGTRFRALDRLFSLSSERYIEVNITKKYADFLRPGKEAAIGHARSGKYAQLAERRASDAANMCLCRFRFDDPSLQGSVSLHFHFAMWERIDPHTTQSDWSYPLPPRAQSLYDLGLRKRPAPPPEAEVVKPSKRANPFAADADNRPPRTLANYDADRSSTIDKAAHRHTVQLPFSDWQNRRISTTLAQIEEFTPKWDFSAGLRAQRGDEFYVLAPLSGTFAPSANAETIATSNDVVGYIRPDGPEPVSPQPVLSGCAGSLIEVRSNGPVRIGDRIAVIKPATRVLPLAMAGIPESPVRLRACRLGDLNDVIFGRSEIRFLSVNGQTPTVVIPFPSGLNSFREGHAFSVLVDDPRASRASLALEKDCMITRGKSHEVLVHHGQGKLTPVAVEVGMINRVVEIRGGLSKNSHVVRDLETLCRIDDRLRGAMTGFWWG